MNIKTRYMSELQHLLRKVPEQQRQEWLYDYEQHFELAALNGKSEAQAAAELGEPRMIAAELMLGYRVVEAEAKQKFSGLSKAVFATVSLGLFNIVFVIGPYLAVAATLLALWVSAAALGLAGIVAVGESFWSGTFTLPQALSLGLVFGSLAFLLILALKVLTRLFYAATLKYLKWNTRLVKGDAK
jgi:uncharacterized membrane protein